MLLGYPLGDLALLIGISLLICITVCTLAMEAAVLFTPAFLFVFPRIVTGFPTLTVNEAIGLSLFVEFFGYTSSVSGYWFREQIDFNAAARILTITIPLAVVARIGSYFVPSSSLLALFGILLLALAVVLYYSHEHGGTRACMLCGDSLAMMEGKADADYCCSAQAEGTGITDGGQPEYAPRTTFRRREAEGEPLIFDLADKAIKGLAGILAGLLGIAVGELTNTMLTVRKRLPVQLAVGTAAFVLHVTILAALLANLVILRIQPPGLNVAGFSIPLGVGAILAPTVIIGGQVGSLINSKMSEETAIRVMIVAYMLVGLFVLGRILVLGGGAAH
ncbi:TSUP family transporter [Halobaculum sp. EA56]|uniref:TSUP family transporter n=1 Tax=Halobaculum sp. EA56 TaxID=3421648 RepID=UPI003EB784E1